MSRQKKTPQQKKQLELKKDHFTLAEYPHAFRKSWPKKKAHLNRQYRRKSDAILSVAKMEMSAGETEAVVGDVTAVQLESSVLAKRSNKWAPVSLGERIEIKLQKRQKTIGRRVGSKRKSDLFVRSAMTTLLELEGDELVHLVNRIAQVIHGGDPIEWSRLYQSKDHIDRAIFFVEQIERGDWSLCEALRRDRDICKAFQSWAAKANRILAKQRRPAQRKLEQKIATKKKIKAALRKNLQS